MHTSALPAGGDAGDVSAASMYLLVLAIGAHPVASEMAISKVVNPVDLRMVFIFCSIA